MSTSEKVPIQTATLAEIYLKQGFLEKARSVFSSILDDDPGNEDVQRQITRIDQLLQEEQGGLNVSDSSTSTDESPLQMQLNQFNRWLAAIEQRRAHV